MQVISDKLEGIELKVRQLASKLESLQQDNAALLEENKKLRAKLSEKSNAMGLLQGRFEKRSAEFGTNERYRIKTFEKVEERY